jgi:epidermal growth factor receptor substrate 15
VPLAATADDFFGNDAAEAANITESSAQLGNLKNQLSSTDRSVSALQNQRADLERTTSDVASQISELQTKLAQSKAAHETESRQVSELVERQKEQQTTLSSLREQFIRAESDLSALRQERAEVEQGLLRDKEDVRTMKAKMKEVFDETADLKVQLEKIKKEARQQKGLVAISKKQLATAEAERNRAAVALAEEPHGEPAEAVDSQPPTAAAVPLPTSPPTTSPTPSTKSTNPFDRLGPSLSPQATGGSRSMPSLEADGEGSHSNTGGAPSRAVASFISDSEPSGILVREENPFGPSDEGTGLPSVTPQGASTSDFDDAFRVPEAVHSGPTSTEFDDNFSSGFGTSSVVNTAPVSQALATDAVDSHKNLGKVAEDLSTVPVTKPITDSEASSAFAAVESLSQQPEDAEESSDDDDDEGPEEPEAAVPSAHARSAAGSFPLTEASRADSAGSVTSLEKNTAQKFPELDQQIGTESASSEIVPGPTPTSIKSSDNDMFQDAATSNPASPSTVGNVPAETNVDAVVKEVAGVEGSRASDAGTEDFVKVGDVPDAGASPESPKLAAPGGAVTAFDSTFDSPFSVPSHPLSSSASPAPPVSKEAAPVASASQATEFDDAFDDLPEARTVESKGGIAGDDGFGDVADFDDDFTFEPSFGDHIPSSAPNGSSAVAAKEESDGGLSAFDAAFASFDTPVNAGERLGVNPFAAENAFGDSFSAPPQAQSPDNLRSAPQLPPRKEKEATPAASDDSEEVKQVRRTRHGANYYGFYLLIYQSTGLCTWFLEVASSGSSRVTWIRRHARVGGVDKIVPCRCHSHLLDHVFFLTFFL